MSAPATNAVFGEFSSVDALLAAARGVRDAGYTLWDAHTPFPVHGLDKAMGVRPTRLPWLVLTAGLAGLSGGFLLTWWTNAVDYPYLVSGKPLLSIPANVPVMFELTILCAAFTTFFAMLGLNGLPRLFDPLARHPAFRRATQDRFLIAIRAKDPLFDPERARALLASLGAGRVETVVEPDEPALPPVLLRRVAVVLGLLALLPPLLAVRARYATSEAPRLHVFTDMDFQPKRKAQARSALFEDGRSSRPPVEGTVAQGDLRDDEARWTGKRAGAYVARAPLAATPALLSRGRERFEVFCAPCHGLAGDGDGLVSRRAELRKEAAWVPPTSIHADPVRAQTDGQLFESITSGVRAMPAYAREIPASDRWAIVLYLRALQRGRTATLSDVPADALEALR